ncbi:MAG: HipA family kinase [Candidatus Kapaibacteriota bacterium]
MAYIDTAVMLNGEPFKDNDNTQPTWQGTIRLSTQDEINAYVKLLDARSLMVECICSILGRKLGLPIPEPFLVEISHQVLPDIVSEAEKKKIAFGSRDANYPSLSRRITGTNKANKGLLHDKLLHFEQTSDVGVFDEWIVNDDRHEGNVLFDGRNSFSFIDHDRALSKDCLHKEISPANWIFKLLKDNQRVVEPSRIDNFIATCNAVETQLLTDDIPRLSSHPMLIEMATFITDRVEYLQQLVQKRLAA